MAPDHVHGPNCNHEHTTTGTGIIGDTAEVKIVPVGDNADQPNYGGDAFPPIYENEVAAKAAIQKTEDTDIFKPLIEAAKAREEENRQQARQQSAQLIQWAAVTALNEVPAYKTLRASLKQER